MTSAGQAGSLIAETVHGRVRGKAEAGALAFKGIRYGAPTGGGNRFLPPRPPTPWAGVAEATEYGCCAPQLRSGAEPGLLDRESRPESEDCLFLNVWTPALQGKRPVMIWLHTGGFFLGSGSSPRVAGTRLAARQDVVVVTLNHRLGLFGHLDVSAIGAGYAGSGNAGMLDIVQALEWVRDNIAWFGGDPGCVTLFGQSGGGWKACTLMAMPKAKGLFHRVAIQSGPRLTVDTPEIAAAKTASTLDVLGFAGGETKRLLDLELSEIRRRFPEVVPRTDAWLPVVDGISLHRQPFSPDAPMLVRDIPVIIGTTRTETAYNFAAEDGIALLSDDALRGRLDAFMPGEGETAFAFYKRLSPGATNAELLIRATTDRGWFRDTQVLADRKFAQGGAPIYHYVFERRSPVQGGRFLAPHTAEIPFVFDTLADAPYTAGRVTPAAQALADDMSSLWASFARDGEPAAPGVPRWAPYDPVTRPTMIFDEGGCLMTDRPRAEEAAFMGQFGSLQEKGRPEAR